MEKESVRSTEQRPGGTTAVGLTGTRMQVRKRNGSLEPVDLNKIVLSIQRPSEGLPRVDAMRVATRTVSGLYDGATTRELDQLSIQTAASLTSRRSRVSEGSSLPWGYQAATWTFQYLSIRALSCARLMRPSMQA